MLQLSEIITIFAFAKTGCASAKEELLLHSAGTVLVPWIRKNPRHRGERLCFDPLENLENSRVRAKRLRAASPAMAYILPTPPVESAQIYPCRCELLFHSDVHRYSRTFQLRMQEGSHSVCVCEPNS